MGARAASGRTKFTKKRLLPLGKSDCRGSSISGRGRRGAFRRRGVQLDHPPRNRAVSSTCRAGGPAKRLNRHYLPQYMFRGDWAQQSRPESAPRDAAGRATNALRLDALHRALSAAFGARGRNRALAAPRHRGSAAPARAVSGFADLLYQQKDWCGVIFMVNCALAITERPRTYLQAVRVGQLPPTIC